MADFLGKIDSFVWGPAMLILLVGTGLYLSFGLGWMPIRKIGYAFKMLFAGRDKTKQEGEGEITPFQALMTALSATIGTGNIAGVATAIFLGGPGAVVWMWITALVGMATKYGEAVLAVKYREVKPNGAYAGGPMYYIKNGLGDNWKWLAWLFAFFGSVAAFGIGNTVQSNSVAAAAQGSLGIPYIVTGIVLALLTFAVIIGGIKRIAEVTERLVPFMAVIYVIGAIIIIGVNVEKLPAAVGLIINSAFNGHAAAGGFAGATVMMAIRFGVARGVFSNEAGLGSAPIAHAAARTNNPVRQGIVGMLGTFIDTIIVCSMTALVIIMTGAWKSGQTGAELSALAFKTGLPGPGDFVVAFGLIFFAFSTILGWSYYGERCIEYIFGTSAVMPYRYLWVIAVFVGAAANLIEGGLGMVWTVADIMNALMAVPNLIALLLLSPVIFKVTKEYFANEKAGMLDKATKAG
ncbi:MAG: sodium:alanine symporter family protein [Peptococcaceae bacterium]|nr:sodium:alanine symporter family protein [Peptococcaceae bacterium]